MKTFEGKKLLIFSLFLFSFYESVFSDVVFTGDAIHDFDFVNNAGLNSRDFGAYHLFANTQPIYIDPEGAKWMYDHDRRSGMDIDAIHMVYDDRNDFLFVGVQCAGICGDTDGDGNPGAVDPLATLQGVPLGTDWPDLSINEQISLMMWSGVPEEYEIDPFDPTFYFPNMVVGVNYLMPIITSSGQQQWLAYEFNGWQNCKWPAPLSGSAACLLQQSRVVTPASSGYRTVTVMSDSNLWNTGPNNPSGPVHMPGLFTPYPNFSHPHIEFVLDGWSNYPNFDFVPGIGKMRVGLAASSGCTADTVGEDTLNPEVWELWWDCAGFPKGPALYDACGVCDGDNTTCWDCAHIPNGPALYDSCGVCDGDNSTCWDCEYIPNGPARYDACGVCDGDNTTCWDCAHIPNGNAQYDECGVCDGDNHTCWDCFHIPNGPSVYDRYGICGGNNTADCFDDPYGDKTYDACGVCGGDNSTCWDCEYTPNGPARYDACGVCDGDNTTCWDCFHIPNGPSVYDTYGICGGNNTADCSDDPYGNRVYDDCGVCGGDGSSCACLQYLGYQPPYLCYALLRWTVSAARVKLTDTLNILYDIKNELPYYDYKSEKLQMVQYIDTLHNFCDHCLDNFDYAQVWFADILAGNCVGVNCEQISAEDFAWSL